jgi:hypothetical protein
MDQGRRPDNAHVNDSWDNARKHPVRTIIALFGSGLVGIFLIMYLGPDGGDVYPSAVTGVGCGLFLAVLGWKVMRDGVEAVAKPIRPASVFNVLTIAGGVALLVWGTVAADWKLAFSALPLIALGAGLMLTRYLVGQRRRTG